LGFILYSLLFILMFYGGSFDDFGDFRTLKKIIWGVLVGAFSDFGGLDTDNPVQI